VHSDQPLRPAWSPSQKKTPSAHMKAGRHRASCAAINPATCAVTFAYNTPEPIKDPPEPIKDPPDPTEGWGTPRVVRSDHPDWPAQPPSNPLEGLGDTVRRAQRSPRRSARPPSGVVIPKLNFVSSKGSFVLRTLQKHALPSVLAPTPCRREV
jgi:hypothetical protein